MRCASAQRLDVLRACGFGAESERRSIRGLRRFMSALQSSPIPTSAIGRVLTLSRAMPMSFYIYPDFRLLFIRAHGVVTQAERVETMLAWLRDPGYELCTSALFDIADA